MKICKSCSKEIEQFGEFPGQVCFECYEKSAEGQRIVSAEELAKMWGG
jgi:hypothetical protein